MADRYKVYWQPGCSSCLRAKEFLASNDIPYDSINVRTAPDAMADLARLGAQSVPVVARGDAFVFAQDLGDLARFLGVTRDDKALTPEELVGKLDLILAATQRYLAQFPAEAFGTALPGRERDTLDLAYHIFVIPVAFLTAAGGAPLAFEFFERRTPDDARTASAVATYGQGVRDDLAAWWRSVAGTGALGTLETYYGVQSAESVLERTAWHAAQHARQLMALLEQRGIAPDGPLGDAELGGLPLPEGVYDDEVALSAEA
jgi:glutaredoxin